MSEPAGFYLYINDHGKNRKVRLYATTSDWSRDVVISDDLKSITLIGNQQMRFVSDDKSDYVCFPLLNKRVRYSMDLSHVKKDWNFAVYTCDFSRMNCPEYRDAQTWPPRVEMDYQEANKHAFHYTAHKEGDRNGSLIMGLGGSVQQNPSQKFVSDQVRLPAEELYGVGKYIDTDKPFWVVVEHHPDHVRLELEQDGKKIYKESYDAGYLSQCKLDNPSHNFIFSLWTGGMWWMDGGLPSYNDDYKYSQIKGTVSDFSIQDLNQSVKEEQQKCCCPCHLI